MLYCLHLDRRGTLWLGSQDGGLACYRDGAFSVLTEGGLTNTIFALAEDYHGRLWVGSTERSSSGKPPAGFVSLHVHSTKRATQGPIPIKRACARFIGMDAPSLI